MPDAQMGDGPGIQALHADGDWFLVFRDAWGDCPSGCLFSELHFFVADENRIARIDSEDAPRVGGAPGNACSSDCKFPAARPGQPGVANSHPLAGMVGMLAFGRKT